MSTESRELADYYLILDIKRNATQDDIEMAYAKAALKHHPDVAGDSPDVQARFSVINEAYSVLSNPLRKREYDDKLGASNITYQQEVISSGEGSPGKENGGRRKAAVRLETHAAKEQPAAGIMSRKKLDKMMGDARKLISRGDFWRADSLLRQALFAYPRDPEIRRVLAKAAEGKGRYREAVEELKAAVEIEYFNPENHYLMGRMYMKGGQLERASKAFNDALSWQEDYEPAVRALAEIRKLRKSRLPWWKRMMGGK